MNISIENLIIYQGNNGVEEMCDYLRQICRSMLEQPWWDKMEDMLYTYCNSNTIISYLIKGADTG